MTINKHRKIVIYVKEMNKTFYNLKMLIKAIENSKAITDLENLDKRTVSTNTRIINKTFKDKRENLRHRR